MWIIKRKQDGFCQSWIGEDVEKQGLKLFPSAILTTAGSWTRCDTTDKRGWPSTKRFFVQHDNSHFMNSIAFFIILAAIIVPCMAIPDSVITGPYKISFDLGLPHNTYYIKIDPPIETESLAGEKKTMYIITLIKNSTINTQSIAMDITEYKEVQDSNVTTPEFSKWLLKEMFPSDPVTQITIDKREGAITQHTSGDTTMSIAIYYPDDYTCATYFSSIPLDEGTLSFLKTLHIEKNGTE